MIVATVRIVALLNEDELAALLWDALADDLATEQRAALKAGRGLLSKRNVRRFVREQLLASGQGSVACGPSTDQPYTAAVEATCLAAVRNAFGGAR
jgi:hypothetical protein